MSTHSHKMIDKIKKQYNLDKIETPAMFFDLSVVGEKFNKLNHIIDDVHLFYSVKTNSNEKILKFLKRLGSGFEIASTNELKLLKKLRIPANKIIIGNTIKTPEFISNAYKYGVDYFAFDSRNELDKIAKYAAGSKVSLRMTVDNTSSEWPLSKKFGAPISEAMDLLKYAKKIGLTPNALTFHVGSQCLNSVCWSDSIMKLSDVYHDAKKNKIDIDIINLGGGFPSQLTKKIPTLTAIRKSIDKSIADKFKGEDVKFYVEPGRGIVGEAATVVSSVIGNIPRGSENWLLLDIGVYNGLLEAVAGIEYEYISYRHIGATLKDRDLQTYSIGGPTCDSWDTLVKDYMLPIDLRVGDIILIPNTGAYTLSEVTGFNGFGAPNVKFIK